MLHKSAVNIFNITGIAVHSPAEDKCDRVKCSFYDALERAYKTILKI